MYVKPKKHLGQHFLRNPQICEDIASALTLHGNYTKALEVGPGTGALTQFLLARKDFETTVVEVDKESIAWLKVHFPQLQGRILEQDFLRMNLTELFGEPFALIGNYPYNISSQIVFTMLEYRDSVPEMVGMFQKEVAERIASGPGGRDYGILSVLAQADYDIEYLFTVGEHEFDPPPKVKSGVIRMKRRFGSSLGCDEKVFKQVVKLAFNQRRKTLRNSLKSLQNNGQLDLSDVLYNKRPEQLGVEEFVKIVLSMNR
jgi:16S rRNA (adenine1518-N6/adenine1519-N6)-dimethyltransferase